MTWPTIVAIPPGLKRVQELIEHELPRGSLELFALMWHEFHRSQGEAPAAILPLGKTLSLRKSLQNWADVERFLRDGMLPSGEGHGVSQGAVHLPTPARSALETGYRHREEFGIASPADLLALGVWALQASHSTATASEKAQRYREIALRHYPSALERSRKLDGGIASPTAPAPTEVASLEPEPSPMPATMPPPAPISVSVVSDADLDLILAALRPDEEGRELVSPDASLWHGSAMGRKTINQDATFAQCAGRSLFFSLCDGVSASVASRHAAALASIAFVRSMAAADTETLPLTRFVAAGSAVQRQLEALRTWLLGHAASPLLASIAAPLPESTMRAFLEKTAEGNDVRRVALATTLIGGYLARGEDGRQHLQVARYGDGVVEHYRHRTGDVQQLMSMEAGRYRVEQYLSPLPATALAEPEIVERIVEPGDWILLSSDGLGRGDGGTLWEELGHVFPSPPDQFFKGQGHAVVGTAFSFLSSYVEQEGSPLDLFDDNWSLIVIQIGEAQGP